MKTGSVPGFCERMRWTHADTAALMAHVQSDGTILVPPGGIGAFGAGARIGAGTIIHEGARIGAGALIEEETLC